MKSLIFKNVSVFICISLCSFAFAETVHEVEKGETLYSISRAYGTTVADIQRANGLSGNELRVGQKIKIPSEPAAPAPKAQVAVSADGTHTVEPGDTLYSISRAYGVTVDEIRAWNGLHGNELRAGQTLKIPQSGQSPAPESKPAATVAAKPAATSASKMTSDGMYTVESGDTWLGIAHDNGLSFSEILALNNATENTMLQIGQKIKVANIPTLQENDPRSYSAKKGDASLVWPVKTSAVTYVNGKVSSVNLAASKNEPVTAIMSGTVMFAGSYRGFGNVVFIQSKTGHIYTYSGLGTISVSKGEYVSSGMQIGTAGVDTYSQQSQISLMVFQNGLPIDPAKAPRG